MVGVIGNTELIGVVEHRLQIEDLTSGPLRIGWGFLVALFYGGLGSLFLQAARVASSDESPFSKKNSTRITTNTMLGVLLICISLIARNLLEGRIAAHVNLETASRDELLPFFPVLIATSSAVGWVWARGRKLHDLAEDVI